MFGIILQEVKKILNEVESLSSKASKIFDFAKSNNKKIEMTEGKVEYVIGAFNELKSTVDRGCIKSIQSGNIEFDRNHCESKYGANKRPIIDVKINEIDETKSIVILNSTDGYADHSSNRRSVSCSVSYLLTDDTLSIYLTKNTENMPVEYSPNISWQIIEFY